jgi:uncharacterized protein YwgA
MTDLSELVVGLISLNEGEMAGKTRLQKSFFLLDRMGMGSGVDFDYYNFGPFSVEVAMAADDAVADKRLLVDERPGYYAVPYAFYSTNEPHPKRLGKLTAREAKDKLDIMKEYSALELEVAATIVYLRDDGYADEAAIRETKLRKPVKATDRRVARSLQLIHSLGL